ncbi:MAG: phosphonate ABC transporter [Comamonadaceae bacterium CG_4_9_14_3_um_filter_60_33]|nr:MAG: phosphonate ABC transporter [Comamonadaceae bacterium CG2_30_59_20]PIY30311.1 MAG: phosphonate ABC transporter [Comamonadaceae bacterium CG_4_10_14_3_um_filter_60_42]PJB47004.1 MAG: phosphonate ABC transporter [Comamonadaceae bacterium CG_4_9_14_3_um_filter_60_33]
MEIALQTCSAQHPSAQATAAPALKAIDLTLAQGEQVAIIGPSGAGKTTLLQLMACALKPTRGQLLLDGRDPWTLGTAELQRLRGQLCLAPQVPPLPPRQRVITAVLAGLLPRMGLWESLGSLLYPQRIELAEAALARFDLAEKLFERVDRLSGGERQRVGLARLAVANARLLLVDEPLSALDPERARQACASITAVAREQQATLVATLHHVDMALQHFPRIIGMRDGEVAFDLPTAEVSPERLTDLYARHLDELAAPAPPPEMAPASVPAVPLTCR